MSISKHLTMGMVVGTLLLSGCQGGKQATADTSAQKPAAGILQCDTATLQADDLARNSLDWKKMWALCPASPVAGYNHAIQELKNGRVEQARAIVAEASSLHPDFLPLQQLGEQLKDPFAAIGSLADAKLKQWLMRGSDLTFNTPKPVKSVPPPLPELVKGEYEKAAAFQMRVEQAREERLRVLKTIEDRYAEEVSAYNAAVANHNAALEKEKQERLAQLPARRAQFVTEAMHAVLGNPSVTSPVYDPETERFYALLVSGSGAVAEKITISVPVNAARSFKEHIEDVRPVVPYSLKGDRLERGVPYVTLGKEQYNAMFTDEGFTPVTMTAVADAVLPAGTEASVMVVSRQDMKQMLTEDEEYFGAALSTQDDPKLARLRQEQAETRRQLQLAQQEKKREEERERLEHEIRLQQKELAALGGTYGQQYEGLDEKIQWTFCPAKKAASDTVAVVIGNRAYKKGIPLVHYAYNDALAVKKFLIEGARVPEENILFQKDATKGEMEGLFRRTLPMRVTPGKTDVIVYFSGHGMPVENEALLLPSDARPETADIAGYSRDELIKQLAALEARSVIVILDACFSGTAKDSTPLIMAKPVYRKPQNASLPQAVTLISASSANQISRMLPEEGMSLMTLYLLKGLSGEADTTKDNKITVAELRKYLTNAVSSTARKQFDAEQTPEVLGADQHSLISY